eukprot:EG_transcript_340
MDDPADPRHLPGAAVAAQEAQETLRRADALLALGRRCAKWVPHASELLEREAHHVQPYLQDHGWGEADQTQASLKEAFLQRVERMNGALQAAAAATAAAGHPAVAAAGPRRSLGAAASHRSAPPGVQCGWQIMDQLRSMKQQFERRDSSGLNGIDIETFLRLLHPLGVGEEQLRRAFQRLDVQATGRVQWDEFSTFLIASQEYLEGDTSLHAPIAQGQLSITTAHVHNSHTPGGLHKGSITHFASSPASDVHYTAAHDHCVKVWTGATLAYETTLHHSDGVWITDLCHLPLSNRLVVSQLDRLLYFYDCETHTLQKVYKGDTQLPDGKRQFIHQDVEVANVDCQSKAKTAMQRTGTLPDNSHLPARSRLITTRQRTDVTVLLGLARSPVCLAAVPERGDCLLIGAEDGGVGLWNFRRDAVDDDISISPTGTWQPHTQWVSRIQWSSHIGAFISSSHDDSLQVWNMDKGESLNHLRIRNERDGGPQSRVHMFDYSERSNLISSCGGSSMVFVWDPDVNAPIARMTGHRSPVIDVQFLRKDWSLLSLGDDQVVKYWDIRTFQCYQTGCPREQGFGDGTLSKLFLDTKRDTVLSGEFEPVAFSTGDANDDDRERTELPAHYQGHRRPIVKILYSRVFDQVVTLDRQRVLLWDVAQQQRVAQWHVTEDLVDAGFDVSQRRLLTVDAQSAVVMWNYLTGTRLKDFTTKEADTLFRVLHMPVESHGSQHLHQLLLVAGRLRVHLWEDDPRKPFREEAFRSLDLHNNGDVTALLRGPSSTVLVGTERGVVLVYNVTTYALVAVFAQGLTRPAVPKAYAHLVRPEVVSSPFSPEDSDRQPTQTGLTVPEGPARVAALHRRYSVDAIEVVCFLQPSIVALAMGTGAVYLWHASLQAVDGLWAFWGAHTPGAEVACCAVDQEGGARVLCVGDGQGYVSLFDVEAVGSPELPTTEQVTLTACWRCSPAAIHGVAWLPAAPAVLVATGDGLLRSFGPDGTALCVYGCGGKASRADRRPSQPRIDLESSFVRRPLSPGQTASSDQLDEEAEEEEEDEGSGSEERQPSAVISLRRGKAEQRTPRRRSRVQRFFASMQTSRSRSIIHTGIEIDSSDDEDRPSRLDGHAPLSPRSKVQRLMIPTEKSRNRSFIHLDHDTDSQDGPDQRQSSTVVPIHREDTPEPTPRVVVTLEGEPMVAEPDAVSTHQFTVARLMALPGTRELALGGPQLTPASRAGRPPQSPLATPLPMPNNDMEEVTLDDLFQRAGAEKADEEFSQSLSISQPGGPVRVPGIGRRSRVSLAPFSDAMPMDHSPALPSAGPSTLPKPKPEASAAAESPSLVVFRVTGDGSYLPAAPARHNAGRGGSLLTSRNSRAAAVPKSRRYGGGAQVLQATNHASCDPPEPLARGCSAPPAAGAGAAAARKLSAPDAGGWAGAEDGGDDYARFKRYLARQHQGTTAMEDLQIEELAGFSASLCARWAKGRRQGPGAKQPASYSSLHLQKPKAIPDPRKVFRHLRKDTHDGAAEAATPAPEPS